jgi:beta-mannan synthase
MYNESSCCQTIIDACCRFEWPSCRLLIQVVDDSTNEETKDIIDRRVKHWRAKGINIVVERRLHREGFKAGAMNEAMKKFPEDAEYIAIFDADFLPHPKFLRQTVPYLMADSKVGFVQTCWIYTNSKESILTRMQEISLNFHFNCEQEMRFRCKKFFNFNGTAGVWRKAAIDDSGGWHTDTLVEDMDLSLRAFANGWDFVYLHDVKVLNEIPPTFSAYRGQQHRWTSGPMQVLKKALKTIFSSNHLSFIDKAFCIWFFLRNYVHVINFVYFLVLVTLMIWVPRVTLYEWALVYLPCAISMSNIFFTPKETLQVVIYVLFENAMCLYKVSFTRFSY